MPAPRGPWSAEIDEKEEGETQGGSSLIQKAPVTLTANQIKNLKATPVQLIAAQGANKGIIVHSILLEIVAGITPFVTTGVLNDWDLGFAYDSPPAGFALATDSAGLLDLSVSRAVIVDPALSPSDNGRRVLGNTSLLKNKALFVFNGGGAEFTAGNGTLTVTAYYTVVDLS